MIVRRYPIQMYLETQDVAGEDGAKSVRASLSVKVDVPTAGGRHEHAVNTRVPDEAAAVRWALQKITDSVL